MEKIIESVLKVNPVSERKKSRLGLNLFVYLGVILLVILSMTVFTPYYQRLVIEMMIFGLLAMSLDLLIGYTGLISFGHAAFFGLSTYTLGLLITKLEWALLPSILFTILFTSLAALIIGVFCVKFNGIQFSMLTLAFGQLLWTVTTNWRSLTNGLDGFTIMNNFSINLGSVELSLNDPQVLLIFTSILLLLSFWSMNRLVKAPLGHSLLAIKGNEERTKFLGFNHTRIKLQIFVISAFYASIAGICFLFLKSFVAPDYLHWSFSGNVLMMTLLGGMGTLLGPLLGALTFILFQDWASSITENWMAFVGLAFIIVVLYLPKGVFGWAWKR